jgi:Zn-dependent protease
MLRIPGKIPLAIHPFFWVLAFFIGWINTQNVPGTLIWVAIIVISIVVHEFGHALTAVSFGQTAKIDLMGFGGVTQRKGGSKLNLWKEFLIVLNGPLAGFALAGVAWVLYNFLRQSNPGSPLTYAAEIGLYVNVVWTILNLIPVQPLDGGKLFSIILESIFGVRGIKIALFISLLLAGGLGLFFFSIRQYFVGALFMLFTFESYKLWQDSLSITEKDQDSTLQGLLKYGEDELRAGRKGEALNSFRAIRNKVTEGVIYQAATENEALLLVEKGDLNQAYDNLLSLGKKITPQGLSLLHQLAFNLKKWNEVISLGDKAYKNHPSYQIAIINAAAHAVLGNVKQAIGWIQCAIQDGLPHPKEVLARNEFDGIRLDPAFRELSI